MSSSLSPLSWLKNFENLTEIFVLSGSWQIDHFRLGMTSPLAAFYWELFSVNWSPDIPISGLISESHPNTAPATNTHRVNNLFN